MSLSFWLEILSFSNFSIIIAFENIPQRYIDHYQIRL
jgi:hypothetical protein